MTATFGMPAPGPRPAGRPRPCGTAPPAGLAGLLRMIRLVLRRDLRQHLVGGEGEPLSSFSAIGTGLAPGVLDHRAIDRKAGVRIHDLGAGLAEHQDREEHGGLAARQDDDRVGVDLDAVAALQVLGHRLAQRQDALRRRVAVMAVAQRLDGRLDDVRRRLEVGLADAEVDDVLALRASARRRAPAPRRRVSVPSRPMAAASCIWSCLPVT